MPSPYRNECFPPWVWLDLLDCSKKYFCGLLWSYGGRGKISFCFKDIKSILQHGLCLHHLQSLLIGMTGEWCWLWQLMEGDLLNTHQQKIVFCLPVSLTGSVPHLCWEIKAGSVHRSSWVNDFCCFSCLVQWWTFSVRKVKIFFKDVKQRQTLATPGVFFSYTWCLFQPRPPSLLPSWIGDFPCIWTFEIIKSD